MYIHQKKEVEAAAVLKNSLEESPPSLPPLPILTRLCQALEDANAANELQFTVKAMIKNHLQVSFILSGWIDLLSIILKKGYVNMYL